MATDHDLLQLLEDMDGDEDYEYDPNDPNAYGPNKKRVKWTSEEVLPEPLGVINFKKNCVPDFKFYVL